LWAGAVVADGAVVSVAAVAVFASDMRRLHFRRCYG
jgi:hypothetical protein